MEEYTTGAVESLIRSEVDRSLEELLHSARRAGVPPGWIREAMEPESDPAAQADD